PVRRPQPGLRLSAGGQLPRLNAKDAKTAKSAKEDNSHCFPWRSWRAWRSWRLNFFPMQRREFLYLTAAAISQFAFARDLPRDVKIVRITAFDLVSRRPKFVGKNARLDDHGDTARDRLVILSASDGSEGFGCCRAPEKSFAEF